jgi:predicted methyltransferase
MPDDRVLAMLSGGFRSMKRAMCLPILMLALAAAPQGFTLAQDASVRPGINKPYENPEVGNFVKRFEGESREVFRSREAILAACNIKPGMAVADVGAGTGLFTRLIAPRVLPKGKVYAVDISKSFVEHIAETCKEQNITNVETVLCTDVSTELPPASVDLVFSSDTYHHFEFPFKVLASIHQSLRPGGQLIIVDYTKEPGKTSESMMKHVRADKATVIKEITDAGFKLAEDKDFMKEQYFIRFVKQDK